jgi:flavin-binding protein dodecin
MTDHVYRLIEVVGSSETSIEDAIQSAISKASSTIRHIRWFEVVETRGQVENGRVHYYQVTMKIGFSSTSISSPEQTAMSAASPDVAGGQSFALGTAVRLAKSRMAA